MMKFCRISLTVVLVSALLSGCLAVSQPRPITGQLAKTQVFRSAQGYTVFEFSPPQGANWYETERTKKGLLTYGKKLDKSSDTFIAYVFISDRPRNFVNANDFLDFTKKERAKDNNPSRFNMLIDNVSIDETREGHCTKYHRKAEDMAMSQKSGEPVFLEAKGYSCFHPTKPHIITIEYSERSSAPFKNGALIAEGEAFIKSLVLN